MRPEHWLYTIPLRLRSLFRWAQADQDLDDELRDHLERKTEEYAPLRLAAACSRATPDLSESQQSSPMTATVFSIAASARREAAAPDPTCE